MREHDIRVGSWWLSERSTPDDLEDSLLQLGLVRIPGDYELNGMLLTTEPPPGPEDVEARRVRTADEYAAARLLQFDVFDSPTDHRRDHAALVEEFERGEGGAVYAAWLDGELAAAGRSFAAPQGAVLAGGAAPTARSSAHAGTTPSNATHPHSSCRRARCRRRSCGGSASRPSAGSAGCRTSCERPNRAGRARGCGLRTRVGRAARLARLARERVGADRGGRAQSGTAPSDVRARGRRRPTS